MIDMEEVIKITGYTSIKLLKLIHKKKYKLLMPTNEKAPPEDWAFFEEQVKKFISHSKARQGQAKVFSATELTKVINWFMAFKKPSERKNACLIAISHYTGLRNVEISRLLLNDLVDENWELKDKFLINSQRTKTNRARTVVLYHPKLIPILNKFVKDRREVGTKLTELLFVTTKHKQYSRVYLANYFKHIYGRVGYYQHSSHSGRRYFITEMLSNDVPIKTAQILAGHTSSATTARYHEPREDDFIRAINKVG